MLKLRLYQENGIMAVATKLARGIRKIIFQLATGGGKTVVLAAIAFRYIKKNPSKKVLILVHREELLDQTIKLIFKWYDIMAFPIAKTSTKRIQLNHNIYVGMVDTVDGNIDKLPSFDMVIMDETHIGNFKKMHDYFPESMIIGFSATPIASTKKDPLNNYFEDIVCGVDVPELIALNQTTPSEGLCQNKTYSIKGSVDRKKLKVGEGGDFNEKAMGAEFMKSQNVMNALQAYKTHGEGKKCVVFNCSIAHSQVVNEIFKQAGIPSRHLDAKNGSPCGRMDKKAWRKDCIRWFRETPGAVLHNVGILTTGFDEPSVEVILVNRSTMSLALWLQMCGRGSRPYVLDFYTKYFFTIIDLGGNAVTHGDWCDARDWEDIFHNPDKPSTNGVAPVKECPNCEAICAAQASICKSCGYHFEFKEMKYDQQEVELVLFTKNIDVEAITKKTKEQNYKEYYSLFAIAGKIVEYAKINLSEKDINSEIFSKLLALYNTKAKEWYNLKSMRFTQNTQKFTEDILKKEITKHFKNWNGDNI